MKITNVNHSWLAAAGSGGALLLLAAYALLCPFADTGASAAECTEANLQACPTKSLSTQAAVEVATTIAVALDPAVRIEVTPTAAGAFSSQAAKLAVSTNSAAGYSISMTTGNGTDTLIGPSAINPTPANTAKANFRNNTWGYSFGASNANVSDTTLFNPVPKTATSIKSTSAPSSDNYSLTFGTKVDSSLPSGEYSNEVIVSAIANPRKLNLNDISTMQAMTPSICANSAVGATKQLKDTRDNKLYYVTKIKNRTNDEARCWMTQNLAYDFVKGKVLTPNDSDVTANWTVPDNALAIGTAGGTEATSLSMWKGNNVTNDHGSYGNYYSFGAATAGSGNAITTSGKAAPASICPAGWRLPTNTESGDLLGNYLLSAEAKESPYYYVFSGYVSAEQGVYYLGGSNGYYWLGSVYDNDRGYFLHMTNDALNPTLTEKRYVGLTVRCIGK